MEASSLRHVNLRTPLVILAGLLLAIAAGWMVGSGSSMLKYGIYAAALGVYVLFLNRHTWLFGLLICVTDFAYLGLGFQIGSVEISVVLVALCFGVTWWQKAKLERPEELQRLSYQVFHLLMLSYLVYCGLHTFYNARDPYSPADFGLKNMLKGVMGVCGPLVVAFFYMNWPRGMIVKPNYPFRIAQLLVFGIGLNVLITIYLLSQGRAPQVDDPAYQPDPGFYVPILEAFPNGFALRVLCPFAMAFSGILLTSSWLKSQPRHKRRIFLVLAVLSMVGAILSAGRATLAFVFFMIFAVQFIRRRYGLVLSMIGGVVLFVAALNLASPLVRSLPPMAQRSLQWALLERNSDALGSIASSSDWRWRLFLRALDEWRSDPRIFWFGRATYAYGMDDYIAFKLRGDEGLLESSLRRGSTHNLLTDQLVVFGLVGFVLYAAMTISMLVFLWQISRARPIGELGQAFALVCFLSVGFNFAYGLVGGANFPILLSWWVGVLISHLYFVREAGGSKPLANRGAEKSPSPRRSRLRTPAQLEAGRVPMQRA